jgi:hypothetical protein
MKNPNFDKLTFPAVCILAGALIVAVGITGLLAYLAKIIFVALYMTLSEVR